MGVKVLPYFQSFGYYGARVSEKGKGRVHMEVPFQKGKKKKKIGKLNVGELNIVDSIVILVGLSHCQGAQQTMKGN